MTSSGLVGSHGLQSQIELDVCPNIPYSVLSHTGGFRRTTRVWYGFKCISFNHPVFHSGNNLIFFFNSSRGAFPQFLPSPPSPAGQGASNFLGSRRPFLQLLVANTSQENPFPETALTREPPGARRVCPNDGEMQPHGGATQSPSHSRVPLKDQQLRGQLRPRL